MSNAGCDVSLMTNGWVSFPLKRFRKTVYEKDYWSQRDKQYINLMECHAQLYSHTYKGTHGKEDKELSYFVHNARLTDNRKDNNKAGQSIKGSCKMENGSSQDTGHMVMKSVSLCKLQLIS